MPDVRAATALLDEITHTHTGVYEDGGAHQSVESLQVAVWVDCHVMKASSGVAAGSHMCAKCLSIRRVTFFAYCTPANNASFGPESACCTFDTPTDNLTSTRVMQVKLSLMLDAV
jgi:hypothetical protein